MQTKQNIEALARLGYGTRGVVYLIVGGLALVSAFGGGGREVDSETAIQWLLGQPFGQALLWAVCLGLLSFVLWRVVQVVVNPDNQPRNAQGYAVRAGIAVSAVTHLGLAFFAAERALRMGSDGGQSTQESLTGWLMGQPFGRYLVGVVGLLIIGAGIAQIRKGVRRDYAKRFKPSADAHDWIDPVSIYGLVARGVLFCVIGGFFIFAGITVDPSEAGSLSDAMVWVRQLPFGAWLYGLAAFGLFAFGAYGLIEARYRQIDGPSLAEVKGAVT
jgi:hypothetical protein